MSDVDKQTPSLQPTESWPFGDRPRPIEAYLRALDPKRDKLIHDNGYDIRTYPKGGTTAGIRIVDARRRHCSGDNCKRVDGDCVHLWEDDFRFGKYKGRRFVPPAKLVQVLPKGKEGAGSFGLGRVRDRPNPTIDGVKLATKKKQGRILIPEECNPMLKDAIAVARRKEENKAAAMRERLNEPIPRACPGRPKTDGWDIAHMSVVRYLEKLPYEALNFRAKELESAGIIGSAFDFRRVVEAMNKEDLGPQLDQVIKILKSQFRDTTHTLVLDGLVLSTARTDNSRTKRFSREGGPVQLTACIMYDVTWGFIVEHRATWFQHGRGSAETIQFPYLAKEACKSFNIKYVLADTAYKSTRNQSIADDLGFSLVCKPKSTSSHATSPSTFFDDCLMQQLYAFRPRAEGWNHVVRATTWPYMVSRPDRNNRGKQSMVKRADAEKQKDNPEMADILLPYDLEERERIVLTEQFVGFSASNEMKCRQIVSLLRAIVMAKNYYRQHVNFAANTAFIPRPEDEGWSIFRGIPSDRLAS